MILAPISTGELLDKISILEIKQKFAKDTRQLNNVVNELELLRKLVHNVDISDSFIQDLKQVNLTIWITEEKIRSLESLKDFGDEFVECARKIYFTNDKRASIKRLINETYASEIVEEKIFASKY